MTKYLVLILALSFLPGCGVLYKAPTTGPISKIRVIANNSKGYYATTRDATHYETNVCDRSTPLFPLLGGNGKPDPVSINMPTESKPAPDRFERIIPAEKEIKLYTSTMLKASFVDVMTVLTPAGSINVGNKNWSCNGLYTFTPKAERSYEIQYIFTSEKCSITIEDISNVEGKIIRTAIPIDFKETKAPCSSD